jgi:FG-GAP-like repeat
MLVNSKMDPCSHGKVAFPGFLLALLLLGACHKGGGGAESANTDAYGPNPFPSGVPGVKLQFTRHELTGLSGSPVIAFSTPPYVVGTTNDGKGNLSVIDLAYYGLSPIYTLPRTAYGFATADFDGDGFPDLISEVYSPTTADSYAYLFRGTATGVFTLDPNFGTNYQVPGGHGTGYRGRTETIVVADFNNDGAVDIFLPTYSFLDCAHDLSGLPATFCTDGPPPNVNNAYQSYLLLNDGKANFREAAVVAGISMHSTVSGLSPASTDPDGNQPEGAQAVDFNLDGLIDLFAGGHLFINQGIDANGVPHFKDMAPTWGLTPDMLRGPVPWLPNDVLPQNWLVVDEGAKFIDWNNDGNLSLLVFRFNWGPAHGPRLFEFDGSKFTERVYALSSKTATCQNPPAQQTAFFWSSRKLVTGALPAGINAYDLDGDGLEEVVVSGDSSGSAIFYNYGCGFVEVSGGDLTQVPGGNGGIALGDFDGDGKIDLVYPEAVERALYHNDTQTKAGAFTVEVLGPNGEHNQYGRVIQVFPPGSARIFTRVVDSGSGYLTQNQYPILVGTPFSGAHTVKVYYAPLTPCVFGGAPCKAEVLSFSIQPGQRATTYAPSTTNPNGRVVISAAAVQH